MAASKTPHSKITSPPESKGPRNSKASKSPVKGQNTQNNNNARRTRLMIQEAWKLAEISKKLEIGSDFLLVENQQLKDMLLSQLDIIQQQSEAIASKDKRLRELQRENELLQLRLASMERRRTTKDRCLASFLVLNSSAPSKTQQQQQSSKDQQPQRQQQPLQQQPPQQQPQQQPRANQQQHNQESSNTGGIPLLKKRKRIVAAVEVKESDGKRKKEEIMSRTSFLETEDAYYTFQGEEFVSQEEAQLSLILAKSEVPGWRILNVPRAYSMEGTENIEDDTLLKRHQKPEIDEKRRKRWDIQRIREQRQVEKLRARYEDQMNNGGNCGGSVGKGGAAFAATEGTALKVNGEFAGPSTILPQPENATHILISDTFPISAFGGLLPVLPKKQFSLPWLEHK